MAAGAVAKKLIKLHCGGEVMCYVKKVQDIEADIDPETVTMEQIEEIAKIKMPDLNTNKLQSAMNTVMGTAGNMGIKVEG